MVNELLNESDDVFRIAAAKGQVGAALRAIFYAKDRSSKEAIIERLIHEFQRKPLWRRTPLLIRSVATLSFEVA
jgi:hypothetical protein